MSLSSAVRELQQLSQRVRDQLDETRIKFSNNEKAWMEAAEVFANFYVKRFAAAIFTRKYASAGIETHSGNLLKAISEPEVWLSRSGKGGAGSKVVIAFKSGMPGTASTKDPKKKSVYIYGTALNYGAVHQPKAVRPHVDLVSGKTTYKKRGLFGAKLAKSLKRKAFGAKAKQRVEQYLERNKRLDKKGVSQHAITPRTRKYKVTRQVHSPYTNKLHTVKQERTAHSYEIKSAGVVITRARNFFQLTQTEQAYLRAIWMSAYNRKLSQLSKLELTA